MLPATFVKGFHDEESCRKMKYNELGNTGLKVSLLGFGGASHGDLFGVTNDKEAADTLRHAIRSGVNYLDTAPYYGATKGETSFGKALKGIPRESYYIASKVARYNFEDGSVRFDFSAEATLASVDATLQRLGLDYVDIIQVHDVDFDPTLDIVINETLPALQKVKDAGKARFIGITGYPLSKIKEVLERSTVHIDTVLNYSRNVLFDTTLNDYMPYLKSKGVGVIDAAGMSMGILTNQGPQKWHPADKQIKDACANAAAYCREKGVNIAALAAHFNLSQEGPATHLISCANVAVVDMNLKTAQEGITEKEKVVMKEIIDRFFKPLKVTHWEYVENNEYWNKIKNLKK